MMARRIRRRKRLLVELKETTEYCKIKEKASENSLQKRLWTCHKTDCIMMIMLTVRH